MEFNQSVAKLIRYLFFYGIICFFVFLISYFGNALVNDDLALTGFAREGYLLVHRLNMFSLARMLLIIILTLGFGKLLLRRDSDLDRISKIVVIVMNVFFILFSTLSRFSNGHGYVWLENQYNLEIATGIVALLINSAFIIFDNKNMINNLNSKRRVVFEYICSFLTIFLLFIFINNSILYTIENTEHDYSIIFASYYMTQMDFLKNVFEVLSFGIIGIGLYFVNNILVKNYRIDNCEKKYIKSRVITCFLVVLLTFVGITVGQDTIEDTSRLSNLRSNLESINKKSEIMNISGTDYSDLILTNNQIDEYCNAGTTICVIHWMTFLVMVGMTTFYVFSVNKSINKIV